MSEEHLRRPSDTDEGSQRSRGEGHSNNKGRTYAEYAENDVDAEEAELEGKVLPLLSAKRKGGAGGTPGKSRKTEIGRINEEFKRRKKAVNVAVVNDERLTRIPRNVEERYLGHVNYTGPRLRRPGSEDVHDIELFLLPKFTIDHHYATIEVRVPAFFLSCKRNVAARLSAVWGTDIYADDSDMVAMLIHSGWYRPFDSTGVNYTGAAFPNAVDIVPPKVEPGKTEGELVEAQLSPSTATKIPDQLKDGAKAADVRLIPPAVVTPIVGKADPKDGLADHDIFVTLRVLPRLVKYAGSLRNGVESRGWGSAHDGESVRIEKVVAVEKGMVSKHGRKSAAKQWSAMAKVIGKTKPGSKEADGSALHAGWGEAEPAKGAGPVTVVFSDDGEACIKYGQRFLLDWPPYLRAKCEKAAVKKVIGKETPAEPTKPSDPAVITYIDTFEDSELLNAQKWPYWRLGLSKGSLIMEDGKRHRYELALAEVHSSNPPPTEKAFSETSTRSEPRYRLARRNSRLNPLRRSSLERKQAREPRAVDAPDIIASALKAEDIDWTDKGLALASGETVNVARFFWMTNSKPATKSAQDADVKGLGIKPAEEKQPS
ncbi:histone deacetylation protein Rxt3-domain-containing protein [Fimicolochytrium jonesii]|uniref:histone deacetylation protein Rxt3-domain-containing protein n=1 Tax=Fimicolochytrium jonesii TaxID=1396493 RepID=UPI0022FEB0F8|nr:histone deacetylation protein Rxt3-domain-containing protein [Fimicolochytrium jonesii]KAI8820682.1 histone deacetylation protein Rxt3-domain-containing protein [Fimicolochytrium jonesii]